MSDIIRLTVTRFSPQRDAAPRRCTYELPYQECTTVLEALRQVQARYDDTLSFRWSCAQGKCGTCTVVLNGKPVLACLTLLPPGLALVEPPRRGRVLRDLSTDAS
jgi:succinate dehydrogenase/fumarate reductase iron-sulfur protein